MKLRLIILVFLFIFSCSKKPQEPEGKTLPELKFYSKSNKLVGSESFSRGVYLLSFVTSWCEPCKAETQFLREIKDELGENIKPYLVTCESLSWIDSFQAQPLEILSAAPTEFNKLGLSAVPTRIIIKNGREVFRLEGNGEKENTIFKEKIYEAIGSKNDRRK